MKRITLLCSAASLVAATPVHAQSAARVTVQPSYESYSFSTDRPYYQDISQLSVPVGVFLPIGRSLDLAVSGGYANVRMTGTDASDRYNDLDVSGLLDTQFRLSYQVVPDRVVAFATGVVPTGIKTLDQQEQLSLLGWLASDVMGFQAPVLGTGGSAGGGFGAALPLGQSWSFGVGGSARMRFGYTPVEGFVDPNVSPVDTVQITPGTDVRVRMGVEGAVARNTYVRISAMYATQTNDKVSGTKANKIGDRFIGYVSLNQRIGNGSLVLYAYDVYRTDLEYLGIGAVLPPGNLLGSGARYEARVSPKLVLTPRVEFRVSEQIFAPPNGTEPPSDAPRLKAGQSLRFGADVTYELSSGFKAVLRGSGLSGMLRRNVFELELNDYANGQLQIEEIDLSGWRAGIHFEWRP